MAKQVGFWNSSMMERPKRKGRRNKGRRYKLQSYQEDETPRETDSADNRGGNLDSQVLFIDANRKKDVRIGTEVDDEDDDLHGDPYRAFTYNQLIALCREKDAKLKKQEYTIKAMKSDVVRKKMREKARLRGELRTKRLYKEDIQRFRVFIETDGTLSSIGLEFKSFMLKVAWRPRVVRILSFDILTRTYLVASEKHIWQLHEAYDLLDQSNDKVAGREIYLKADCYISSSPHLEEMERHEDYILICKQLQLVPSFQQQMKEYYRYVCVLIQCGEEVYVVKDRFNDFYKYKEHLVKYLDQIASFEKFASKRKRQLDMEYISLLKKNITSPTAHRLSCKYISMYIYMLYHFYLCISSILTRVSICFFFLFLSLKQCSMVI